MSSGMVAAEAGVEVLRVLADRWQDAADETQCPTLRACYAKRAARYRELAARQTPRDAAGQAH
jgi:hypothetical protein